MAEIPVGPIDPINIGNQEAAIVGSSGAIFTAADRQIIKQRVGEINPEHDFIDVMREGTLAPDVEDVENEESNATPQHTPVELKGRRRDHRHMLKHSTIYGTRERVEITNALPDNYEEGQAPPPQPPAEMTAAAELTAETVLMAKELKFNPTELFNKLAIEQDQLHYLISRIKELHLQRLLAETKDDFYKITERIRLESLTGINKEARLWLEAQLDKLTLGAAEYKHSLLQSLQKMEFDQDRHKDLEWLAKTIEFYSAK